LKGENMTDIEEKIARFEAISDEAKQLVKGLSEEELQQVVGGKQCLCVLGGGGTGNGSYDSTCACVLGGAGMTDLGGGDTRCMCPAAGFGSQGNEKYSNDPMLKQ
jgi:bacteriocin-like protein